MYTGTYGRSFRLIYLSHIYKNNNNNKKCGLIATKQGDWDRNVYYPPKTAEGAVPHINRYGSELSLCNTSFSNNLLVFRRPCPGTNCQGHSSALILLYAYACKFKHFISWVVLALLHFNWIVSVHSKSIHVI